MLSDRPVDCFLQYVMSAHLGLVAVVLRFQMRDEGVPRRRHMFANVVHQDQAQRVGEFFALSVDQSTIQIPLNPFLQDNHPLKLSLQPFPSNLPFTPSLQTFSSTLPFKPSFQAFPSNLLFRLRLREFPSNLHFSRPSRSIHDTFVGIKLRSGGLPD